MRASLILSISEDLFSDLIDRTIRTFEFHFKYERTEYFRYERTKCLEYERTKYLKYERTTYLKYERTKYLKYERTKHLNCDTLSANELIKKTYKIDL